jgi:hypothetical protein
MVFRSSEATISACRSMCMDLTGCMHEKKVHEPNKLIKMCQSYEEGLARVNKSEFIEFTGIL